jgi:hypothetical protein
VLVMRHYHGPMAMVVVIAMLIGTVDKPDVLDVVLVVVVVVVVVLLLLLGMGIAMGEGMVVLLMVMLLLLLIAERGRVKTLTGYGLVVCADGAPIVGQWLAHRCILTISHVGMGVSG